MSNYIEVIAVVEGKTEQLFITNIVAPYLLPKQICITATQISKVGQKGGNVRFERIAKDLGLHLKQRPNTYVTTFVDYYGVKEWPGLEQIPPQATPVQIAQAINNATKIEVMGLFAAQRANYRFIPYIAVHEFEALLFSDSKILSAELGIAVAKVDAVIAAYGEPEAIDNSPQTAPSKRLDEWSAHGKFPKTTMGIAIARKITITQMRKKCPLFDAWLRNFEAIQSA